jgi:hypothetical protein
MTVDGSLWVEAWTAAAPMPAALQKPLFDHTAEAERVCCTHGVPHTVLPSPALP